MNRSHNVLVPKLPLGYAFPAKLLLRHLLVYLAYSMSRISVILPLIFICLVSWGQASAEFRLARPGWEFAFPRDHAAHPEFKTEWWYYTGHLNSEQGAPFSYQLTFFRVGVRRPIPRPARPGRCTPSISLTWP